MQFVSHFDFDCYTVEKECNDWCLSRYLMEGFLLLNKV